MIQSQEILAQIQLDEQYKELDGLYSPTLGYAYMTGIGNKLRSYGGGDSSIDLIGFTGNRQRSRPQPTHGPEDISSVTEFDELQSEEKTMAMQSGGVGTRIYNTPQALLGTGEGSNINAYMFTADVFKIVKRLRQHSPVVDKGIQALRQIDLRTRDKLQGTAVTVDAIHAAFGDPEEVDAVLYSQSLTMEMQQAKQGLSFEHTIPPEFMIIRNPHIIMRKIGSYRPE